MIPKTIHYCWLSKDPYPALVERCLLSWKEKLPEYEFMLWNTERFDVEQLEWTKQAFSLKKYAFVSDYIRLYALYHYGGIYLDTDVEVLKGMDDLLGDISFIGWESSGILEAAIIGAQKGTPWLKEGMAYYENTSFIKVGGGLETMPMPLVLQARFMKEKDFLENFKTCDSLSPAYDFTLEAETGFKAFRKNKNKIQYIEKVGLKVYPSSYFSPKNLISNKINSDSSTYCIHYFNAKWVKKNIGYYTKYMIHWFLLFTLGEKNHEKMVNRIRARNKDWISK
ncbi:MAG: glycosyltransferase [Bacteroidales bacterium]